MSARHRPRIRPAALLGVLAVMASACSLVWNFKEFNDGPDASDEDSGSAPPDATATQDAPADTHEAAAIVDAGMGLDVFDSGPRDAPEEDVLVCPSGYHPCSGVCSSNFSPNSCGPTSCEPCMAPMFGISVACPTAMGCVGSCGNLTLCDGGTPYGICVDPTTNPAHCGGCGDKCPAPTGNGVATCVASACGVACDGGQAACPAANPSACVDTAKDSRNCGGCGNACVPNDAGEGGVCVDGGCQ